MSVYQRKTSFNKTIKYLLILITLTWSVSSYSDGYADIGYRDGLSMQVNMSAYGPVYIRAELGEGTSSYGIGTGWNNNYFRVMGTVDRTGSKEFEYGLHGSFYDRRWSGFTSINYNSAQAKLGYRIGAGYALNTDISLIAYYSDKGAFVGFRRWFN